MPLYIAAVGALILASAVWRCRQRLIVGMCACLLMAAFAIVVLVLPAGP
ncbi:hypothetical protein NKJ06_02595 [Mesorhizobium sp. M0293]